MHYLRLSQLPHFAEALKLGQWPDKSHFLPTSHKEMAPLYPSWQKVRIPGEGMGSRTAQWTQKICLLLANSILLPIFLQEQDSFLHSYCSFMELLVIADRWGSEHVQVPRCSSHVALVSWGKSSHQSLNPCVSETLESVIRSMCYLWDCSWCLSGFSFSLFS